MKVLLINNDKGWSGGQEHLKDLATGLAPLGVEVHFVVRAGSPSAIRYGELGFRVHTVPAGAFARIPSVATLARMLRRERFDIISVNREHDLPLIALAQRVAFPFGGRGKLMMSYHTATSRKQPMLGFADAVVCISEHVRDKLLQANPGAVSKTSILYYGISIGQPPGPDKFDPDRQRRFFKGFGFPLIGMVGEFWKNQGELIDALPRIKNAFPGIKVALVGDNGDRGLVDPLQAKIKEMGLEENVIFTGRIPRERIPDLFYDLDLSVTTHRNEGFGIVHLESLAAGTPVVGFNSGGYVDIFKGEDVGALVDGGAAEFGETVAGLLSDDLQREAKGRQGHLLVKNLFSLTAMASKYYSYYKSL